MKRKKWIFSADNCRAVPFFLRRRFQRIFTNFQQNQSCLMQNAVPCRPLDGQKQFPAAALHYGKHSLSWNGCEIIAVYNALIFLGNPIPISQIAFEFELNRLYLFFASCFFGSNPKSLCYFFTAHEIPFTQCSTSLAAFQKAYVSDLHTCGILSFWNNRKSMHRFNFFSGGLHTVAFQMLDSGGCLVYNRYASDAAPHYFPSLDELLADRRFISGYWL